jgi:hypothetical protein
MVFEYMFDAISQHLPTDKRQAAHGPANFSGSVALKLPLWLWLTAQAQPRMQFR